ncbi:MAG: SDR family oxidoreductase [Bacteroidia bacterium]|nr:SDR family oxidoreductase [Bacteroidia bacterium]
MKIDLSGQNILVTGASRGIGRALAEALAGAGARVAVHFHQKEDEAAQLAGQLGHGARAFQADLGQPGETMRLWEEVLADFGHISCLVNNAGVAIPANASQSDAEWLEAWERTLAVNLTATAILSRLAVRHFQNQCGGRLIHIASRAAFRGDTPDYLAYAASKGGMVALHRSLARGFGKAGIKSFLIAPGFVRTDMAQDFMDAYGEDYALNDIALPTLTEPADLGPLTVLLASGLADHATGGTFDVNAGSYVH